MKACFQLITFFAIFSVAAFAPPGNRLARPRNAAGLLRSTRSADLERTDVPACSADRTEDGARIEREAPLVTIRYISRSRAGSKMLFSVRALVLPFLESVRRIREIPVIGLGVVSSSWAGPRAPPVRPV